MPPPENTGITTRSGFTLPARQLQNVHSQEFVTTEMADSLAPQKFTGRKEVDAKRWIMDAESYALLKKADFHTMLPLMLEGSARTWYETVDSDTRKDSTKISKAFIDKYGRSSEDIVDIRCKLINLHQGSSSVQAFFNEFQTLYHQISDIDEATAIAMAKRQLAHPYSTQLYLNDYKTLEDLENAAIKLEQLYRPSSSVPAVPAVPVPAVPGSTQQPTVANFQTMMSDMMTSFQETLKTTLNTAINNHSVNAVHFEEDRGRRRSTSRHRDRSRDRSLSDECDKDIYERFNDIIYQATSVKEVLQKCSEDNICAKCGEYRHYTITHFCKAEGKTCRKCLKDNHFAAVCMQHLSKN